MTDHDSQKFTPREMVRAHAYPVLAVVSTISLVVIAASLVPIAKQADYQSRCVEEFLSMLPNRNAHAMNFVGVAACAGRPTAN